MSQGNESSLLARHGVLHVEALSTRATKLEIWNKVTISQSAGVRKFLFIQKLKQLNSRIGITLSQFDDPVLFELFQRFIFSFTEFLSFSNLAL